MNVERDYKDVIELKSGQASGCSQFIKLKETETSFAQTSGRPIRPIIKYYILYFIDNFLFYEVCALNLNLYSIHFLY